MLCGKKYLGFVCGAGSRRVTPRAGDTAGAGTRGRGHLAQPLPPLPGLCPGLTFLWGFRRVFSSLSSPFPVRSFCRCQVLSPALGLQPGYFCLLLLLFSLPGAKRIPCPCS